MRSDESPGLFHLLGTVAIFGFFVLGAIGLPQAIRWTGGSHTHTYYFGIGVGLAVGMVLVSTTSELKRHLGGDSRD